MSLRDSQRDEKSERQFKCGCCGPVDLSKLGETSGVSKEITQLEEKYPIGEECCGEVCYLDTDRGDVDPILDVLTRESFEDFCDKIERCFNRVASRNESISPLAFALSQQVHPGIMMEFGVASGRTITQISKEHPSRVVIGFDSFKGLPERWRDGFDKGTFACDKPHVPDNVSLIIGEFSSTVSKFVEENVPRISFVHIDCDLYSSTLEVLRALRPYMVVGCIIVFDELFNYPGCEEHEMKAFYEALSGLSYKALYCVNPWDRGCKTEKKPVEQAAVIRLF